MWKKNRDSAVQYGWRFTVKVVIMAAVAVLMVVFSLPAKVTVLGEGVKIHGMYGELVRWDNIDSVRIIDELPTIQRRTNGSAIGSKLKGHFMTKEMGSVKLFVDTSKRPYILLETEGRKIIFNFDTPDETMKIFNEINGRTGESG